MLGNFYVGCSYHSSGQMVTKNVQRKLCFVSYIKNFPCSLTYQKIPSQDQLVLPAENSLELMT